MSGGKFYTFETAHRTWLDVSAEGRLIHTQGSATKLIGYVSANSSEKMVLFGADAHLRIGMGGDTFKDVVLPVGLYRHAAPDTVSLAHPYSNRLVIALPFFEGQGSVSFHGIREPAGWESFRMVPAAAFDSHPSPRLIERILDVMSSGGLAAVTRSRRAVEMLEIAGRLASAAEIDLFAAQVMQDATLLDAFARTLRREPQTIGLLNLDRWIRADRSAATLSAARGRWRFWRRFRSRRREPVPLDLSFDDRFEALGELTHGQTSLAETVLTAARRRIPSRRSVCVLATARNEGPYILDWIAYHRALGVEHFFLYTNDNEDGSEDLLRPLHDAGIITWIENDCPKARPQLAAYNHALAVVPQILDFEWVAVIDLDEFIALPLQRFPRLQDFLASQQRLPTEIVALNWIVYMSNRQIHWSEEPVFKRFLTQNSHSSLVKSIFRSNLFVRSLPHNPIVDDVSRSITTRDSNGRVVEFERGAMAGHEVACRADATAWIAHYFTRSAEEFFWKLSRGRASSRKDNVDVSRFPDPMVEGFLGSHDREGLAAPDIMSDRVPDFEREKAALLRLPNVGFAQQKILRGYAGRSTALRSAVSELAQQTVSDTVRRFLELFSIDQLS